MTKRKKQRRFNHLAGEISMYSGERIENEAELYKLGEELGYSEKKINGIRQKKLAIRYKAQKEQRKPVPQETRDNKQRLNEGSGYGSYPTHRYPSKKRSKKTWANFYKLFPFLALQDRWNGKISKKMK